MYYPCAGLVFGVMVMKEAVASSMYRGKQQDLAARHFDMADDHPRQDVRRRYVDLLSATDSSKLLSLGLKAVGINPTSAGHIPWVGRDEPFTNTFHNVADEGLILVVWGPAGSWVNVLQPQLTLTIPSNSSQTVSFPVGWSGAWAAVYSETTLLNGQIFNTWGEGSFKPPYSTVDVSREVNMNGRPMAIVGPQCTTDMDTCVFKCLGDVSHCLTDYVLVNCATGSQAGVSFGTQNGTASGGCGGMGNGAALDTYLS